MEAIGYTVGRFVYSTLVELRAVLKHTVAGGTLS